MSRLAAILIVLTVTCLVTVGGPVFAQGPPEQESGGVSTPGKSDSNISQFLLDSINNRGSGGTQQRVGTGDAVTRDSTGGSRADSSVAGSGGTDEGEELLSGVSKDDFETSQTVNDLVRFDSAGNVEVYIHLKSTDEASLQQVRNAVERVEIEGAEYGLVQAWVDPDNLGAVASLDAVKRITPPDYGYTKKGSTQTEGDAIHRANLVRAFSGLTGEGVKVGVISDGVDAWTSARSRGDLPSRLEINPNQDSEGHEGTALLEIVHDIAPEAELAFSGSESSLGMAHAILWLANGAFEGEGADVIVDDLGYFFQPFFEDGIIAQAAADAVAGGAVFASAAGNYAQEHYEGEFVDGGGSFHAFDGSSDITMRLFSPFSTYIILQWNDQFGASDNDYDLYICPAGLTPTTFNLFNRICDASADLQNGDDDPLEVASLYGETEVDVFIKKDSGQNRRLEMFFFDSYAREYGVEEGGIVHHAAVPGVLAVGAVDADDPGNDDLRSYSDWGPSRIYFPSGETRMKPDVVASDGVSVTGSGGFPSHFGGTSAAAPHVAGIAALLIEAQRLADPTMTKKQVADAVTQKIRDTAKDLGPSGHDNKFGYGRADALAAVVSLDQLSGTTFTVDSTGDGGDSSSSDGTCDVGDGNCTLRAAIQEANRVDGSIIEFDITGGGARTIQPASALPTISRTVFIDGFSQSGASASNYRIELDGTNAGTNTNGLTISGAETWVRGLVINRFGGSGIILQGSGGKQVIDQNRIGTNVFGTSDSGNGKAGVLISGADRVTIRGNLISGNDGHGVELSGGADDAIIDGNIIGANVSGTSDLGNTGSGMHISNGDGAKIANNVIAGNDSHGVSLTGSSTEENLVAENYIGVNENGTSIANSGSGVHIGNGADDNAVRHNTIARNTADGVTVVSSSSAGNTVDENSIHSNGGLGIDLNDDGVTANDTSDRDSGPNNLQNFATITAAGLSSDAGSIGFNLYVTQNNRYIVDFYASDSCDASGNGEGKEWLGYAIVAPISFGDRHFVVHTFRGTLNQYDYPSGTYITSTVTLDGSTSEFSPCVQRTALPRLTLSENAIEVEEDGTTNTTFTVRLSSRPSQDATVDLTIEGDEAVTVSPTPLTFTTSNWDNTQTVTVTAVSDDDPEDEFTVIRHKLTIDSKQYVSEWLPVTVVDYDVPDVALVIAGNHRVTGFVSMEEGQSATYPVVLTAEPDDDVTVSIYSSSSSALWVSTSSLTFTKDNYDTAQNVTITARSDSDAEDELVNVYHEVLVDGSYYEVARIRAFINDPIFPILTLSTPTLSVNEGETATYTVVPETEPSRNFTLVLESSDTESVTVSPPTMTFTRGTNGNWETEQTVTVTGVQDDDEFDDVATIRHKSTYFGEEYFLGSGVEVTVADGNRAPFFEEGVKITRTVPENSPQGTNVGEPVIATDLNGDTVTYTIKDQVGGPYEVDNSGQITVGAGAVLDYERRTTQEVQLTVEDPDGLSDTIEVQIEITDVNEPPVITGSQDLEWQENRAGNLARYSATDPERDTFEWSVIGSDFTFFSIDSSGYLTFTDPPDFEAEADANGDNVYEPTVVARDTAGQFGTLNIKVTVTNANEPPTVTGDDDITIDENTDTFYRAYFASDPEGVASTFTWSLSGTDSGDFNIDSNTGELTFRNTPNYESPADSNRNNEYLVQVRATDEGNLRGSLDVTVAVNDVNEPPTVTGDDTLSYPENTATTRVLDRYSASDPDRRPITWSVEGTDSGAFAIDSSGNLRFSSQPDHETPTDSGGNNVYDIQVVATDDGNIGDGTPSQLGTLSSYFDVSVTVTPVNEPPSVTGDTGPTVDENDENFSRVYTASDQEGTASTFTWSLSGTDRGDFNIDRNTGELTFRNTPDFEQPADSGGNNEYLVAVRAYDGQYYGTLDMAVTVLNVNEAPEIRPVNRPEYSRQENDTGAIYTFSATDPEGGTVTWSTGGLDEGDFTIVGGALKFANPPDHETPLGSGSNGNEYLVTVHARDDQFNSAMLENTVKVTVTDVNEGPEVTGTDSFTVAENQYLSNASFNATDPEGESVTRWNTAGTDGGDFTISENGVLTFRNLPDYERPSDSNLDNEYQLTVRAYDTGGRYGSLDVVVTVTAVDEAPELTSSSMSRTSFSYPENGTSALYTYQATDPEGGTITWSVSGTDQGDFDISETGALTFASVPDFELPVDADQDNEYLVTVEARDDGFNFARLEVTVTVTNAPGTEEPTITTTSRPALTYQENGTNTVYTYRARDPQGLPIAWSVTGTDASDFDISSTGALAFISPPDFEIPADSNQDNVYEIKVVATDEQGLTDSLDVTITVTNHHENLEPDITTGPSSGLTYQQLNYQENRTSTVYTYRATNYGAGSIGWSVSGTDAGDFDITTDSNGRGVLTFGSTPDFESPADLDGNNDYEITVIVTNTGGYTDRLDVAVTVTDVNEGPEVTSVTNTSLFTRSENSEGAFALFHATDPEDTSAVITRWSTSGTDGGDFTIDEKGHLGFRYTPDYERPADSNRDNVYNLSVRASDGRYYGFLEVTVTVEDVDEISGPASLNRAENFEGVLASYSATGQGDLTVAPTWRLTGADSGDFNISEQGELTFRSIPDYERPADSNRDNEYVFTVQASDDRYYGTLGVTVTVTPVNEPPTITTKSSSATDLSQPENQTSRLYTYRATDPEGEPATWSVDGVDGRFFAIDEQGQFSFDENGPPDFEIPGDSGGNNVYDVLIQAQDAGGITATLPVTVTVTEVNEGPEVTGGGDSFTVLENLEWQGTSFTASDPEGGTITRWNLGGRDGSDFTISETGVLTFRNVPDHERPDDANRDNVYEVEVRPYDGRYYGSHNVTVTVEDVTELIGPASISQSENFEGVLAAYSATGQGDLTVAPSWRLTGTDSGDFNISEQGELTFRSIPDHERPADSNRDNEYVFTVQASENRYYGTLDVTVTVTPVNEPPTITTKSSSATDLSQPENRTSRLYTYRATDPEGSGTVTWSVGGVDARFFTINEGGQFFFSETSPPDFEARVASGQENIYNVTVQVSDDSVPPNTATLDVTVTVTDVNEGPEVAGPATFTINENQLLSNAVYSATDPEGLNVALWSVGGRDGGDFFITQGGTLYFRYLPDYERPADSNQDNVYEVTVRPSDGRNYGGLDVTVTVNDVNEPPEIRRGSTTSFTQPENRTSRLYSYSATDPEGGDVTWSVGGTDGNLFTIDERGQFSFKEDNPPDFDAPGDDGRDNIYNLIVQASDSQVSPGLLPVTVTVTEVNEGPAINRQGIAPGSAPENQAQNTVLATYTASDPERPNVKITQWSTSGRDGGDFVINALGELRFRTSPDFERPADSNRDNVYEVTIRASDGRYTSTLEEIQMVTVTDVNEAPTITTTSRTTFSQPENRISALYTFRATDPEGGTVTWTAAGTDGSFFTIDERGQFSFADISSPDFENPGDSGGDNVYDVTVQARDAESNIDSLEVTVTVTDDSEGVEPTISTRRPPATYRENGTSTVYTFRASDPQRGATTWSLTGTDASDFTITTDSSGRGVLAFSNPPDFENPADANRDNEYELTVVATDEDSHADSVAFTITVTDDNEGVEPTISTRRPPSTYRENDTRTVYTFRASDPQRDPISWSLTGTDVSDFTITTDRSGRGALTFNVPPDFENPADSDLDNEYELTVMATDEQGNADQVAFTITVTDVDEGPQIRLENPATTSVPENTADTRVLADYTATDPENPTAGIFSWSTSGRDGGDFVINELGELRFRYSPDYERPADSDRDNVYEVTVRASDGRSYSLLEMPLEITVTEVNEPPVITTRSRTEFSLRENSTSIIYTYRATDQDEYNVIKWSVEGADGEDFAIYNGILTFRLLPDYELPVDDEEDNEYEITVVASDGSLRDTVEAVITITDQPEGPVIAGRQVFTVTENYDIAQALGSYTATDAKDMRPVYPRWSLSGSDGGDFVIDPATGSLTFRNTPDYDRPADGNRDSVYEVTVRGYDGRAYGNLNVTVTVTAVNEEAPVVTGSQSLSFRENTPTTTRLYTYRATDTDRDTMFTWSAEGAVGNATDGDVFEIDASGVLTFKAEPNHEDPDDSDNNNVYEIVVAASDGSNRGTLPVTVTVTDVNEGPVVSGTATFTINESQNLNENLDLPGATYTATDPEGEPVTSWRLYGSDGGDFTITDTSDQPGQDTARLSFRNPPDVDRPADSNRNNEYLVTIRAYDNRGTYGFFDVTVILTEANEPPVITGSDTRNFTENGTGTIYTYRATDPEGDDFTWIQPAGDDGHLFEVSDRGALTLKEPPDYDDPADSNDDNEYLVTVQARDDQGNTGTFEAIVTVTDVNEGPIVSATNDITDAAVQENHDPASVLLTFSAADPEEPTSAISRWSLSGSDGGDFVIADTSDQTGNNTAALTFRNPPDYDSPVDSNRDNEYLVSVRAYDATNRYGSLEVTVTVGSENEADPVVTGSHTLSFRENTSTTTRLYTYRATDTDRDTTITWSVRGQVGNDDGDAFAISDAGMLTFSSPPNYEQPTDSNRNNEYLVEVVATDDQGREGTLDVTITVTEVNEGPEITGTRTYTVTEGQELTGATFTAEDPEDATAAVTSWRLAGSDAGDFHISSTGTNSAQLTFRSTPDYDNPSDSNRDNEYLVTIRAYNGSTYGSLDVTVTVTDQNETEPVVTGSQILSFRENTATDTRLHAYRATDMDRDSEIMWSLEGDDADDFAIDEGVLTFKAEPDYENPTDASLRSPQRDNVYEITVVASDGINRGTLDVTLTVTDVNEGPEISGQATGTVSENFDQVVETYTGKDPEGLAVTRWNLGGPDSGDFIITDTSEQTGQYTADLSFRNAPDFDSPADSNRDNEYLVTIRPYDGRYYGNYEVTINVTSDNEPPVITGDDTRDFRENGTGTIYTYRATDPEGDSFTWSVGGPDGSYFEISDRGVLTFKTPPDFESPPRTDDNEYQVTVEATDDNSNRGEFDVIVTVTDLNEGPEITETPTNADITVRENYEGILATYSATDPEDPTADITRWSVTGTDGGDFVINEDGELRFRNNPDFEQPADSNRDNEYLVTVRASDGRHYGTLEVTVTVEAVDEAPEFRSGSTTEFAYQENGTSDLYTYRATDPEGGDVTWHLSGVDSGAFTISETGVLTFNESPDYEDPADDDDDNVYQVTVVARDEQNNDRNLEVTVTVTNLTD